MIIDAHHHLWKVERGDYFWMADPAVAPIARDFSLEELAAVARACGIDGSVLVQAAQSDAETQWLLEQARASNGLILGVVGWVDMAAAGAPGLLQRLALEPLLRGIRPMLQDLTPHDWVLHPQLDPAFRTLIELDLAFDVLIRPPQLEAAFILLTRYPRLRAVVDHGAKPQIADGQWQPWADWMQRIARETQACCKLSGLATEAHRDWQCDDLRRYTDHLLECFGPQRLMWGSDWPVALLATEYQHWLHTAQQLIAQLSADERAQVMGENAVRFYRLLLDAHPGALTR